jgi:hypothetical protein
VIHLIILVIFPFALFYVTNWPSNTVKIFNLGVELVLNINGFVFVLGLVGVFVCMCLHVILDPFSILRKATISFAISVCPPVHPHGTNRLSLEEFSWNFIFEFSSKICRQNSSSIKVFQEKLGLNMKTDIRFWSYLAHCFLEWKIFRTKIIWKIKKHVLYSVKL